MTATDELRVMLAKLVFDIERLDIKFDSPAYDMTLGEYEDERDRLIESCAESIAATLGTWECEIETTESWLPAMRYHRCKHCGAFFAVLDASKDIPPCVCPNCGRKVVEE